MKILLGIVVVVAVCAQVAAWRDDRDDANFM